MNKGIFLASVLVLAPAWAEPSDAVPPLTPPFVQFPSPNESFTITFELPPGQSLPRSGEAPGSRAKREVKIEAAQFGQVRRDTIYWSDNSQTQTWFVGRYGLVQNPNGDWINLLDPVRDPEAAGSMRRRDASDYFAWLMMDNYRGVVSYRGAICYQFSLNVEANGGGGEPSSPQAQIAWIDVRTKLPVALQTGGQVLIYKFGEAPASPLILPPKFKALADRYQLLGPATTTNAR